MRYFSHQFLARFLAIAFLVTIPARGQLVPSVPSTGSGNNEWSPVLKPNMVGPINVAVIPVLFPDTELRGGIAQLKSTLDSMNGLTQAEYFKIYSNGIVWPVTKIYPSEDLSTVYHAPQLYGYYCKYDYWSNPIGWQSTLVGLKRAAQLRADALKDAKSKSSVFNFKVTAFCYITTLAQDPNTRPDIRRYYASACGESPDYYPDPAASAGTIPQKPLPARPPPLIMGDKPFDPWTYYHPRVEWGEPLWPNTSIQFNDASAPTFAHEFGHLLGAPDTYRIGRSNDGINGSPVLLNYGPTATAFSRFYHHGYVKEKNYPTLTRSGTYTLYPRHIKPENDQAIGYVIPSRHSHYLYQIEYIYGENPALETGGNGEMQTPADGDNVPDHTGLEGVLISVLNLGKTNYLGSPDGMYTYRPNDPWFRGLGDVNDCLFGSKYNRQEFSMTTEPSSRLPNLLDGGVHFKNILEHQGTATFDVEIDHTSFPSSVFESSLLPQVKLEPVDQILPTSFHMTVTSKFRGEPLVDQYGMCWNTSSNPEISDYHFTLANCNYEMYQGRAINLQPDTKYYVRGWASNINGVRYSDEEVVVKTLSAKADIQEVQPLLLDSFSSNQMLHNRFSNDSFDRYGHKTNNYESYAPVAVLAKLAAYYHPGDLLAPHANVPPNPTRGVNLSSVDELLVSAKSDTASLKLPIDFGRLHWDPFDSDPSWRTVETLALFEQMRDQSRIAKMHELFLGPDFLIGLRKMFRYRLPPQFQPVTRQNLDASLKLIKDDLISARPVMIIESPRPHMNPEARIQWGLIDGFQGDNIHIDFPLDTEFLKEKTDRLKYTTLDTLLIKDFDTAIVTSISF